MKAIAHVSNIQKNEILSLLHSLSLLVLMVFLKRYLKRKIPTNFLLIKIEETQRMNERREVSSIIIMRM
jgi:hypothetical protein